MLASLCRATRLAVAAPVWGLFVACCSSLCVGLARNEDILLQRESVGKKEPDEEALRLEV